MNDRSRPAATPGSAPELRVRSHVLAVYSHFACLDQKTPQRTPHVEHALTRSVTGCRRTSQSDECRVPDGSGVSLVARAFGQSPRTGHPRHHADGHYRSVAPHAQSRPRRAAERQVSGAESEAVFDLTLDRLVCRHENRRSSEVQGLPQRSGGSPGYRLSA
jgi:hypothetical protein